MRSRRLDRVDILEELENARKIRSITKEESPQGHTGSASAEGAPAQGLQF